MYMKKKKKTLPILYGFIFYAVLDLFVLPA